MPYLTQNLMDKILFLAKLPQAEDARHPQGPLVSLHMAQYMAGCIVRDIGKLVVHAEAQAKVKSLAKKMAISASSGLASTFDEDDICPPYHWPWPWPIRLGTDPDPDPVSMKVGAAEQVVLADLLVTLAAISAGKAFSVQLKDAAVSLVAGVAGSLVHEFENTRV